MQLAQLDKEQREPRIPVRWHVNILIGLGVVVVVVTLIAGVVR